MLNGVHVLMRCMKSKDIDKILILELSIYNQLLCKEVFKNQ